MGYKHKYKVNIAMMYSKRGKMFNVIKTIYCAEKKRGVQKIVCSFKQDAITHLEFDDPQIQDQIIAANISEEEKEEFFQWFTVTKEEAQKEADRQSNESAIFWLETSSTKITDLLTESQADEIYKHLKEIRLKVRSLGFTEKRQKKESES